MNARILEIARGLDNGAGRFDFFCECGAKECTGLVSLTLADYEARAIQEPITLRHHRPAR